MASRIKKIIALKKKRATLQEIGDQLGVTRQRAQQLVNEIIDEQGEDVFNGRVKWWTVSEAATKLNAPPSVITELCVASKIECRRRSEKGTYLIGNPGMKQLRAHPRISKRATCVVCHKSFKRSTRGARTVCSKKCEQVRWEQHRQNYRSKPPTHDSLQGWHKILWEKLQSQVLSSKKEKWLTLAEAKNKTGFTKEQLYWLRFRKIVTVHPDPVKKWRGQPVLLFAASQMEIAGEVFEKFHEERVRKD